jgi:hypothetical protein
MIPSDTESTSRNGPLGPKIFNGIWWSVELPQRWRGEGDERCATFQAEPPLGALQISAARKDVGMVTDDDLRDFAAERISKGIELQKTQWGSFVGLVTQYSKRGYFWREWWLRESNLLVYVTYNVRNGYQEQEAEDIHRILASLKSISS